VKRLLLLGIIALPVLAGTMSRTATFDSRDLMLTKQAGFDVVDLKGYPALVVPGAPRLPRVVQSLVLPAGAEPTGVELVAEEWADIAGAFNVGPAQPDAHFPRAGETYTPTLVPADNSIYSSAAFYPSALLRLAGAGTMAGYRLANVELRPVRCSPTTGRLQLATRVEYRLTYKAGGTDNSVATAAQQATFGRLVRNLVVNPQDVTRFAPAVRPSVATTLPPGHYEYVVVTEAPMDTVFQRLADWKTTRGVPGNVVKVSWISTNYTGYDLQEKIRNFIKDAYATWGTMYVLLGGQGDYQSSGQNIVPTRMADYESDPEPCDLYYAGLNGTWDFNGNHTYGELADSADMYSDVFVGRAPVYNVAMAQNFVAKVLRYEQNPPVGFLKKMILPTAILWSSYEERPLQESIARMTPPDWSDLRLYERTSTLSHEAVVNAINAGVGLGHWSGHGSEEGIYMGSTPYFSSSDAQALTNGDMTGLAVSIACDCAAWDWVPNGDCLAEHMVNRVGGGFIATIMNTRYGYGAIGPGGNYVVGPSERLDTTYYSGVIDRGLYHTGEALGYSKGCWAPYADSLYQYDQQRYCIYDLCLIGDPETPLWTDEPTGLDVTFPGAINIGNNVPCPVTVSTPSSAPVESALVILRKEGEVYVAGRTDASGQVTLLVSALTPGPMQIIVTAQNHFTTVDSLMVTASTRYVSYLRSTILDPAPGGNGDGVLNPGETIHLPTWVKNWGQQAAVGVEATLRTHDANAQIDDSVKTFGDIAAGDSAYTGDDGFGLSVATGLPNGYAVVCSLICRDELDTVWVSYITLRVGAPVLAFVARTVRDSAGSQPNGRIDPGETVDLTVTLGNSGIGTAYGVEAILRSGDPRLTVDDSTAAFPDIPSGTTGTNDAEHYVLTASPTIPLETSVACTLDIYIDGDHVGTASFNIVVGEIRSIDPVPDGPRQPAQYWAYDDADTLYAPHPTYNWVEIAGIGTRLTLSDDQTVPVSLPAGFGPFRFYDQNYTIFSICSNGFVSMGSTTVSTYTETELPYTSLPPTYFLHWDDLYPPTGGGVWYYHDAANHRFIVEWDSVPLYRAQTNYQKFEVVFYDTTLAAQDGNCVVDYQYQIASDPSSCTVGEQANPASGIFIQMLFDGDYHRGSMPIANGRAIRITTDFLTGVEEPTFGANLALRPLAVHPNPFRGSASINWQLAAEARVDLKVVDAAGRVVRTLVTGTRPAGNHTTLWDGADDSGRKLGRGIYFIRLTTPARTSNVKTILTN
jgi:hypothetical protein